MRSYTSFLISMDLVIIDYIGQFARSVSFCFLALVLILLLNSSNMAIRREFLKVYFEIAI